MKKLIFCLTFFISISAFSQRATLDGDTVRYNSHVYHVDKVVNLLYGSNSDKTFAFVYVGTGLSGIAKMEAGWSKYPVKIDKVYKSGGKVYLRGIALNDKGNNAIPMNKVFIDITGAIDMKEVKED